MTKTVYLAWPDRVEPIEWSDYRAAHEEDAGKFLDSRGPFRTAEEAEDFRWRDMLPSYWKYGKTIYASHCLGCGRWAKRLAFDDQYGWDWEVTDCAQCGILDSREVKR